MDGPYQLLSSSRYDQALLAFSWNEDENGPSPFFLLTYHFQRLLLTAEKHGWEEVKALITFDLLKSACIKAVEEADKAYRVR